MVSRTVMRGTRLALWGLFLTSLLCSLVLYLPLPDDFPPLLLLEFGPRWVLSLGMLPVLFFGLSMLLRVGIVGLALVTAVLAADYRMAACLRDHSFGDLRIGTYNVGGGFILPAEVILWQEFEGLDAVLLQEVNQPQYWSDAAKARDLQFVCQSKLCVISGHEVIARQLLDRRDLKGWGGYAARFDVCEAGDCWPLINIHLTTPRHAIEALFDRKPLFDVRELMRERALESSLASQLSYDPSAVVAGDFNMTTQSPLYRRYWGLWQNAFSEAGCGVGHTKFTRRLSARIDHVLAGTDYRVLQSTVHPGFGGDHRPVTARLKRRSGNQ